MDTSHLDLRIKILELIEDFQSAADNALVFANACLTQKDFNNVFLHIMTYKSCSGKVQILKQLIAN